MITSKKELKEYLKLDKEALYPNFRFVNNFNANWKIQKKLRKAEYVYNSKFFPKIYKMYVLFRFKKLCEKYTMSIPLNVFGPGLAIVHIGQIMINNNCKIGKNFRVQSGVVIGATSGSSDSPIIGNNVYVASGAKIFGGIRIVDNVAIGANAVVVKDINEVGTYGGVPAKKISNNDSSKHINVTYLDK